MAGLKSITPPPVEPVTVEEVCRQLREDDPDAEMIATLTPLIAAARLDCEAFQNRAYVERTLELALDDWPCGPIELPMPPFQSVTSISFVDADGNTTVWDASNYLVDDYGFVASVHRRRHVSWPSICLAETNGIRIRYVAGYLKVPGEEVTGEALGTGDGEEQMFTAAHVPIVPDSETVYVDGAPTENYTIDYATGEVTITAPNGEAVTIDYTQEDDYRANVPENVKQAIILYVMALFDSPGCPMPAAAVALLTKERVVPV